MKLQCSLCGSESEIRHIMEKLWVQEDLLQTHIHICQDCYREYYSAELRKQIESVDSRIIERLIQEKK